MMKRYITKNEWKKKIREEHKKYGFLKGLPFAEIMPTHIVYDLMEWDDGIMSWMTKYNKRGNYTILAYPSGMRQGEVRKRLKEVDKHYKLFMYSKNIKHGKELWTIPYKPYGISTGIKDFLKKRDNWIRKRFQYYKKRNDNSNQACRNTQIDLEKQNFGKKWKWEKRNPYKLTRSAIQKIVHAK